MDELDYIIDLIKSYLDSNSDKIDTFILKFEESFFELENYIYKENIYVYNLLDETRMACVYYVDNEDLRKQFDSYIGLNEFNCRLNENYKKISEALSK